MILQKLLAEEIAHEKQQIISNTLQLPSNNKKFDKNKFWKLKKKTFPKMSQSKMSVINDKGTELVDPKSIVMEYEREFTKRFISSYH